MNKTITFINYEELSIIIVPVIVVIFILYYWNLEWKNYMYAFCRMLIQLLLIGYCLSYIFLAENSLIILLILFTMVFLASWIALGIAHENKLKLLKSAFIAIIVGGGFNLVLVTQFILKLDPWYMPRYMIPLAGMVFASSMNGISLAAERLEAELKRNIKYKEAKVIALKTALIPITNSLLAVGLVSLPGMMTGQILSGVSPHIAVRYQIMVMFMIFSSVGLSSYLFLMIAKNK